MLEGLLLRDKNVVSLQVYKRKKLKHSGRKQFETGIFKVEDVKPTGKIKLSKNGRVYEILLQYEDCLALKEISKIKAELSKQTFYVFWELDYIDHIIAD